ncbi:response regulator [Spirosoma sp. KUDC1026]|uniref:response regulator n=1 Tax=Spirosoma sp. KUDC1026 TaxID=2745947 RepID=UPI00159B8742|nr:response regulator [Spirosoma sp. KUDC1026]QKZ13465.1 response regulator [Spirosoma sp. KUDC1026]
MNVLPVPYVFIADDDDDDRFLLQISFSLHYPHCRLHFVNDGQDLLDQLAETEHTPALIVLDLNMPRLNGFEVLDSLRKDSRYVNTPVVMLTTSTNVDDRDLAFQLGARDFITKPLNLSQLEQIVGRFQKYWLQNAES